MPISSASGLGGSAAFWGCYGFSASCARPQAVDGGCDVGPCVLGGGGQRWGEAACGVCTGGTVTEGDPGGGPALCLWASSGSLRGLGVGGTAQHRPLCPQHPPRPYHTSQCLPGFMGEPRGQPKCSTKSRELLRVPMTRYLSGLWGSVTSPSWELSGVRTEHHTCRSRSNLKDGG